jgi:hypothetical protein
MNMLYGGNPKARLRLHKFLEYHDGEGIIIDCHSCGGQFLSQREHAACRQQALKETPLEFYQKMAARRGEASYE